MAKKSKLKTPDWIVEGYDSEEEYNKAKGIETGTQPSRSERGCTPKDFNKKSLQGAKKGKTFKIRKCPECDSDEVVVVIGGEEGKGSKGWLCNKCGWKGENVKKQELNEEEMMKYLDEKDTAPKGVPSVEGDVNTEGKETA